MPATDYLSKLTCLSTNKTSARWPFLDSIRWQRQELFRTRWQLVNLS